MSPWYIHGWKFQVKNIYFYLSIIFPCLLLWNKLYTIYSILCQYINQWHLTYAMKTTDSPSRSHTGVLQSRPARSSHISLQESQKLFAHDMIERLSMFDQKMIFSKEFQVSSPAQLISEQVKCTDSHQQFLQRPRHLPLDALLQSLPTDVLVFNEGWTNEKTVKKRASHYKQSKLETLFWMVGWFTLSQLRYASFAENVDKFRLICAPLLLTGIIKRLCRNKMTCFTIQSIWGNIQLVW